MTQATRAALVAALAIIAMAAGVALASSITTGSDEEQTPGRIQPQPNSAAVEIAVADPVGGPDWAVRIVRDQRDRVCQSLGRYANGEFGAPAADGTITAMDPASTSTCNTSQEKFPAAVLFNYLSPEAAGTTTDRMIVHGVAGPKVRSVAVETPDGQVALPLSRRGAFLAVFDGLARAPEVRVTLKNGDVLLFPDGASG